ncbi:matrixin family metalloprotease [Companilactobacillus mishanensis]|uniref:Matrixin family metalloprotease n=1 Tax=Companilactobacillus mishanensis TaxID=2486008 RepID=A0ABW9P7S2_9LACO|nr:matrixin family metalloprotease [Companilactobacillus mishanensis]MQS45218.1 matrixin family metalloprotease [Companilactobacillus mishanensis]
MRYLRRLFLGVVIVLAIIELVTFTKWMPNGNQSTGKFGAIETAISEKVSKVFPNSIAGDVTAVNNQQKLSKQKEEQQSSINSTTPIESIVKGVPLPNTYHYHFEEGIPESVKQVFLEAVYTYNQTGIVKLIAGTGKSSDNSVTFSIYYSTEPDEYTKTKELGKGGPHIYRTAMSSYNHGKASINLTYQDDSISQSVATHELGHALGLGHSQDKQSVMYPMDEGMTALNENDINTLEAIYE